MEKLELSLARLKLNEAGWSSLSVALKVPITWGRICWFVLSKLLTSSLQLRLWGCMQTLHPSVFQSCVTRSDGTSHFEQAGRLGLKGPRPEKCYCICYSCISTKAASMLSRCVKKKESEHRKVIKPKATHRSQEDLSLAQICVLTWCTILDWQLNPRNDGQNCICMLG